ncbi:MAG: hypothetical protein MRJ92_03285 [Nitrospira sp.]|nr:hypothetical protein [Nitrospira sp.]
MIVNRWSRHWPDLEPGNLLLNNVHEDAPEVFQTRWTLSYLRAADSDTNQARDGASAGTREAPASQGAIAEATGATQSIQGAVGSTASRPIVPPAVPQYFRPLRSAQPEKADLVYQPMVLGAVQVRFTDNKAAVDATDALMRLAVIGTGAVPWVGAGAHCGGGPGRSRTRACRRCPFEPLPGIASQAKQYETWKSDLSAWVFRTQKRTLS